jgi:hypothetical protein
MLGLQQHQGQGDRDDQVWPAFSQDRHGWGMWSDAQVLISRLWRRGQLGWPRRYPLVQFPNPPLLVAIFGSLLAGADALGAAGLWQAISTLGLVVWAGEEVVSGTNLFRRALGVAVLIWLVLGFVGVH